MTNVPNEIFVAGIDTDAGKSFVAALLTLGLDAQYWKPVQAGTTPHTDTEWVQQATGLPKDRFLPEAYRLQMPASPHAAAAAEGVTIQNENLSPPPHDRTLIIEGAGGLMVPLRDNYLFADWLAKWRIPTVLVVRTYLGSINHSLLSLEAMERRGIPLLGIVFNDGGRPESESVIAQAAGGRVLGRIPHFDEVNPQILKSAFDSHFSF